MFQERKSKTKNTFLLKKTAIFQFYCICFVKICTNIQMRLEKKMYSTNVTIRKKERERRRKQPVTKYHIDHMKSAKEKWINFFLFSPRQERKEKTIHFEFV